ncbi:S16 family serine protease [Ferrimonas balearica]|uniref:S16 family serine protease n=1 Tax=Ferrimonas balearica TaxID=44012 RepID=UPI001C990A48|nr:S16 family serine protease [Ferrimonas balearica]MBY5920431.1 AAA family ATPase [Ferrimonas balearica]MBY5996884.1 AAA family ATPase [Ferrimonas balearica]
MALKPHYPQLDPSALADLPSPWLLGQDRAAHAWSLFRRCANQHLFVTAFPGFDGEALLRALFQQQPYCSQPGILASIVDGDAQSLVKLSAEGFAQRQLPTGEAIPESATLTSLFELDALRFVDQPLSRNTLLGTVDKAGAYHAGLLASCEVLAIPAEGLLQKPSRWLMIKEALKRGYISFSGSAVQIPVCCKVVILGDVIDYDTLHAFDPHFTDLFCLMGESQPEWFIDTDEDAQHWGAAAQQVAAHYTGRQMDGPALTRLARHASRLCEHQGRISLAWHDLGCLLEQCEGEGTLTADQLNDALHAQQHRHNSIEIYAQRNVEEALVRVDTEGEKVGQINGLTVVDYCGHSYGEPARITVSVHYGDGEVADIERKSELGGNIHAKGMMILSACLYRIFGQDEPLHLNANIVFEQSYQTIDGDSASLAEYCSLISTIAEVPVKQGLALTGAIDQFGNVQAIGGINEKIEGFFHVCRYRGLTGEQGVILPRANTRQLNLSDDVIAAVESGEFHLFQVDNVEEALALLTGREVGVADEDNRFKEGTLYGLVQDRLDQMAGRDDDEPRPFWQRWLGFS